MGKISIVDTNIENVTQFGVCGYKNPKKEGFPQKFGWLKEHFKQGLIIKSLVSEEDGTQGMIEYIPGEFCWRPVNAKNYMFIHCLFVGFKKFYQRKGYATQLLEECIKDAKEQKLDGIAVTTRKGSFMAGKDFFLNNGFEIVDTVKPDFQLLVKKFNPEANDPKFKINVSEALGKYKKGITIIRADQCPYTVKNVREIVEIALKDHNIKVKVVDIQNYKEAQQSPCPFGTFCLIIDGKIHAEHPISKGRFLNIIKKIKK